VGTVTEPSRTSGAIVGPDDVLFFLHIPKTGGTSLTKLLARHYPPDEVLPVPDRSDRRRMLRELPPERLAKIRLVAGHFWFGPNDRGVHDLLCADPVTITMLRDPIARTISTYRHVVGRPGHPLHGEVPGDSLLSFLRDPRAQGHLRNIQARWLVGQPAHDRSDMPDDELLGRARQRLEELAFTGIFERFEESVSLLSWLMGWKSAQGIPRLNRAPSNTGQVELSAEERAEIVRLTEVDRTIHGDARRLLDRRLTEWAIAAGSNGGAARG
jgi:sulfotransferase famil protein